MNSTIQSILHRFNGMWFAYFYNKNNLNKFFNDLNMRSRRLKHLLPFYRYILFKDTNFFMRQNRNYLPFFVGSSFVCYFFVTLQVNICIELYL